VITNTTLNQTTGRYVFTRSDTSHYIGANLPTFNLSLGNEVTFGAFRLYGLVTAEDGAWFGNSDRPYRTRFRTGDEYLSLLDYTKCPQEGGRVSCRTVNTGTGSSSIRTVSGDSLFDLQNLISTVDPRKHVRLRELSLTYTLPESLTSRLGLGRTILNLAGKNLMWWDDCFCLDPNMTYLGGSDFGTAAGFLAQPQPRQFLFSIHTSF
jgi:hypothetical protein